MENNNYLLTYFSDAKVSLMATKELIDNASDASDASDAVKLKVNAAKYALQKLEQLLFNDEFIKNCTDIESISNQLYSTNEMLWISNKLNTDLLNDNETFKKDNKVLFSLNEKLNSDIVNLDKFRIRFNELKKEMAVAHQVNENTLKDKQIEWLKKSDLEIKKVVTEVDICSSIENEGIVFYVTIQNSNFEFVFIQDEGVRFIPKLPYHYRVESNQGVSVRAAVNEWLWPMLSAPDIFDKKCPIAVFENIHKDILIRTKATHPKINAKVEAVKNTKIDNNIGLSEEDVNLLVLANYNTLFEVVRTAFTTFFYRIKDVDDKQSLESVSRLHDRISNIAIKVIPH